MSPHRPMTPSRPHAAALPLPPFNLGPRPSASPLAARHCHASPITMEGQGLLEGLIEAFACSVAELREATLLRVDGESQKRLRVTAGRPQPSCAQLPSPAACRPPLPSAGFCHPPRCNPCCHASLPRHDTRAVRSGRGGHRGHRAGAGAPAAGHPRLTGP